MIYQVYVVAGMNAMTGSKSTHPIECLLTRARKKVDVPLFDSYKSLSNERFVYAFLTRNEVRRDVREKGRRQRKRIITYSK